MSNPQTPTKTSNYYLYDDATKIIYYGEEMPENADKLIFIGTSDNPNPKMAAAAFMQKKSEIQGFTLRKLP